MSEFQPSEASHRKGSRQQLRRKLFILTLTLSAVAILLIVLLIFLRNGYRETNTLPTVAETVVTQPGDTATLCAVGDISLSNAQLKNLHTTDDGYNFADLFSQVTTHLATADLTVGNLEGNICGEPCDADVFNFPASLLTALQVSGFDLLQTANTRSIQNGISGLQSTISAIRAVGISPVGTYADESEATQSGGVTLREVNGIRFAFIGFTKGLNSMSLPSGSEHCVDLLYIDYDTNYSKVNREAIIARIDAAKQLAPDVIVAMVHWGTENSSQITDSQRSIASLLLDNGVNVILGSHTHQVQSLEKRGDNAFIAYSLGDFLTVSDEANAQYGCILTLTFTRDASGQVKLTDSAYAPTYCASPSAELGVRQYAILDAAAAIELYEREYFDRVSKPLYEKLLETVSKLEKQTAVLDTDEE